jgi:hypothetical protein
MNSNAKLRRTFVKQRLERGTSARTVRESYNALVSQSPQQIESNWGKSWRKLSGQKPITAKQVHKIQSSLGRKARATRKEARAEMRLRTEATRTEAQVLGLPEPTVDYQKAHDAGALYRATHEERYREVFVEGSE